MHVLLVADGRSPHTVGWIRGMSGLGLTTTLLSSRLLDDAQLSTLEDLVGAGRAFQPRDLWNRARPHLTPTSTARKRLKRRPSGSAPGPQTRTAPPRIEAPLVSRIEVYSARRLRSRLDSLIRSVRPDAVHALRIQYEAIAATRSHVEIPIAVSTWGQDLVATARSSRFLVRHTREALAHADVLMSDCWRDTELADEWGLKPTAPRHVIPGNFGVDLQRFPDNNPAVIVELGLPTAPLVVYPRGVRAFVNYRGFIDAARSLLSEGIAASFLGVGLAEVIEPDEPVSGSFRCTESFKHQDMLRIAAASAVTVSPAWSDGMPNSVLEGMAGGAIPVCGDLDSLRELERHGAVMAWCDPSSTASIASAVKLALTLSSDPANLARNRTVVADHYSTTAALNSARLAYLDLEALV